jgi:hypothetical protein
MAGFANAIAEKIGGAAVANSGSPLICEAAQAVATVSSDG